MAAVSQFFHMTTQQQAIESLWYSVLGQLAAGVALTEIAVSSAVKASIGEDGIAAIAQRCSRFNNSQVEVKEDTMTDTIRICVLAPGTLSTSTTHEANPDVKSKESKPPRPPNSFILYRQHHHPSMVTQNPGMHNNQISQLIGKMWKGEPQSVRDDWKRKADEIKSKHEKDHPNYQYQPRKPSEKKRRMTKRKAERMAVVQSTTSQATVASQQPLPNMLINDMSFEVPSFDFSSDGQAATFALDASQENQINLFNEMLENHNSTMPDVALAEPDNSAASTTAAHMNQYTSDMVGHAITAAEDEFFDYEKFLENALAEELVKADNGEPEMIVGYNDNEAQRFTDFLDQMPNDLWGMEFVDYA